MKRHVLRRLGTVDLRKGSLSHGHGHRTLIESLATMIQKKEPEDEQSISTLSESFQVAEHSGAAPVPTKGSMQVIACTSTTVKTRMGHRGTTLPKKIQQTHEELASKDLQLASMQTSIKSNLQKLFRKMH
jgi:hypothetical protein